MLGLGLQRIVLIQTVLVHFFVSDFLNQQLFEIHLCVNQLLFDVPENAGVDNSVCP